MTKKTCPNCKANILANVKFCPKCGENVENIEEKENIIENKKEETIVVENTKIEDNENVVERSIENNKVKGKSHLKLILVLGLILIIVSGFLVWFFVFKEDDKKNNDNANDIVDKEENNDKNDNNDKEDSKEEDNNDDELVGEKLNYYGNTYVFSEGVAWLKDSFYIYLINDKGKVLNKYDGRIYDGYFDFEDSTFNDGYAMVGNDLYNSKGEKVKLEDDYTEISYYGEGLLVVTIKDENYKGTTIEKGIYDLNNKKYNLELDDDITSITYLGDRMYLIYYGEDKEYFVYDSTTKKQFSIGDRFDVLKTEYKDGYIIYQDTNAYEVYSIDRDGNKKLIVGNSRHAQIGQYSDGLVFINDAFYDLNGNKVIDLKDEGVKNNPMFINGYALVFFDTGYFTVLSKESKEYMFEPKAYTDMDNTYSGSFELGFYRKQTVISDSGHLIVRLYDDNTKTKNWAIMDANGEIVYEFSKSININTVISDNDYIGVSDNSKQESYYVSISGKKLEIVE